MKFHESFLKVETPHKDEGSKYNDWAPNKGPSAHKDEPKSSSSSLTKNSRYESSSNKVQQRIELHVLSYSEYLYDTVTDISTHYMISLVCV